MNITGVLRHFQRIVGLYGDSNLRRDKTKDNSPFRHICTLEGREPKRASGLSIYLSK